MQNLGRQQTTWSTRVNSTLLLLLEVRPLTVDRGIEFGRDTELVSSSHGRRHCKFPARSTALRKLDYRSAAQEMEYNGGGSERASERAAASTKLNCAVVSAAAAGASEKTERWALAKPRLMECARSRAPSWVGVR